MTNLFFHQDVPVKVGGNPPPTSTTTTATTQQSTGQAQGAPPGPNMTVMLIPFLLVGVMWFMSNKRQKKEETERSSLKKGDKVVSQSGLIGELVEIEERLAKVKIAPGTTVQMLLSSISPLPAPKAVVDPKAVIEKK